LRTVALRLSALAAVLALMSCNGSSGGSGGIVNIPTTTANFSDATSDGVGPGTAWDITQVATSRATSNPTVLFVSVTYTQNVQNALPAPGSFPTAAQLGTAILFIGSSGGLSTAPCGNLYAHVGYLVDGGGAMGRLADGNYDTFSLPAATVTGEASVTVNGNTVLYTIPISALGGGKIDPMLVVVSTNGNAGGTFTDCDPTFPGLLTW
jgi:hypothetical protein